MSSTWLKLLPLALNQVRYLREPPDDREPTDTEVGHLDDELKRLYTMWRELERDAEIQQVEMKHMDTKEAQLKAEGKAFELGIKARALQLLFWISVNDHFECWERQNLTLRKGFLVVERQRKPDEGPQFPPFFRHLLGNW